MYSVQLGLLSGPENVSVRCTGDYSPDWFQYVNPRSLRCSSVSPGPLTAHLCLGAICDGAKCSGASPVEHRGLPGKS